MKKLLRILDQRSNQVRLEDLRRLRSRKEEILEEIEEEPVGNYRYFLERKLRILEEEIQRSRLKAVCL